MFYFYIPEGICFADNKTTRKGKHAHKNQKTKEKNTNENVQERATKAAKQIPSGI
jgi:hypothetical protein